MFRACAVLALLLLVALPPVEAQQPNPVDDLIAFDVSIPNPVVNLDIGGSGQVDITVRDLSRDGSGAAVPGTAASPLLHEVTFSLTPLTQDPGWTFGPPSTLYMHAGDVAQTSASFQVIGATKIETFIANLTVKFQPTQFGGPKYFYGTIGAKTGGFETLVATVRDTLELKPREMATVRIDVQNLGLFEQFYDMEVVENTCGMPVAVPHDTYVPPKGTTTAVIELKTPWKEKLWYLSESCGLGIKVYPQGKEDVASVVAQVTVQVNGQAIFHIEKLFPVFVLLLIVLLLILFLVRRKERIEEEILGKPQKPWLIPVEALYLRALRQKDERAWYVVRHHLMEEEYRSSLLWYKSYKKATRGSRKKEALVLRQEKKYERWKAKWAKRIERPIKVADRFEAKLQRKLDRKAAKLDRKDAAKVSNLTKKMAAAHAKQVERALEKWQKDVKKAEKKGLAVPQRPVLPEPDYPEEPEPRSILLADHKWSKKAARFRARRVKEQGNLEVRFEKADARHLAKLRRKVQRMARKLDDPDFVAEHPLLRADS